jgi:hypothetical protein
MIRSMVFAGVAVLAATATAQGQTTPASPTPQAQQSSSASDIDSARLAAARRVVTANGTANSLSVFVSRFVPEMIQPLARAHGLTAEQTNLATRLLLEEMQSSQEDMVELAAQNYAHHLSTEDLNLLADFYESPVGRRYIQTLPSLLNDGMTAGAAYGRDVLSPRLQRRFQDLIDRGTLQHS